MGNPENNELEIIWEQVPIDKSDLDKRLGIVFDILLKDINTNALYLNGKDGIITMDTIKKGDSLFQSQNEL